MIKNVFQCDWDYTLVAYDREKKNKNYWWKRGVVKIKNRLKECSGAFFGCPATCGPLEGCPRTYNIVVAPCYAKQANCVRWKQSDFG